MLVDDNMDDNFIHKRVINKERPDITVVVMQTAIDALEHLKNKSAHEHKHPDLIFLDINMPGMNGWEFIEEYKKLDDELRSKVIIIMLTTSENPDDIRKAKELGIPVGFRTKPLTTSMFREIMSTYTKL